MNGLGAVSEQPWWADTIWGTGWTPPVYAPAASSPAAVASSGPAAAAPAAAACPEWAPYPTINGGCSNVPQAPFTPYVAPPPPAPIAPPAAPLTPIQQQAAAQVGLQTNSSTVDAQIAEAVRLGAARGQAVKCSKEERKICPDGSCPGTFFVANCAVDGKYSADVQYLLRAGGFDWAALATGDNTPGWMTASPAAGGGTAPSVASGGGGGVVPAVVDSLAAGDPAAASAAVSAWVSAIPAWQWAAGGGALLLAWFALSAASRRRR